MGYALFVTVDRSIPDLEGWDMCGKTLARNVEKLDDVTRQLNLTPLSDMISVGEDYLEDLLDEDIEEHLEEQWFTPSDGLATVDALQPVVQENPERFDEALQLLEDLSKLKQYLQLAEQHHALFHLTPDF